MDLTIKTPFVNVALQTPYAKTIPQINGPYTRIHLIRHCHPDYAIKHLVGDEKMPLSDLGKKQRKLLNKKLEQIQLDKIYVSELLRSRQTAEDFAKKNPEKFDNVEFTDGPVTRVPVLDGAAAYIECEVIDIVDTNSGHSVVVAVVVGGDVITDGKVEETLTLQDLGWNYSG